MHMKCSLHPDMHVSGEDCSEQCSSDLTESTSGADGSGQPSVSQLTPAPHLGSFISVPSSCVSFPGQLLHLTDWWAPSSGSLFAQRGDLLVSALGKERGWNAGFLGLPYG